MIRVRSYIGTLTIAAIGVMAGRMSGVGAWWWLGGAGMLALGWWLSKRRRWRLGWVSWVMGAVAVGCLLAGRSAEMVVPEEQSTAKMAGTMVSLEAEVVKPPRQGARSISVMIDRVRLNTANGQQQMLRGGIALNVPLYTQIAYGDRIAVSGKVDGLDTIDEGYAGYLSNHGVYATMVRPQIKILAKDGGWLPVRWGLWVQDRAIGMMKRMIPGDEAAFLLGVVLGISMPTSTEFSQALTVSGTTHMVVASGYNISIIIAVMARGAKYLSKWWLLLLSVTVSFCYVAVCGFEASIVRAFMMGGLTLLAIGWGRQHQALHIMTLGVVCMLWWNAWWLYDTGFQLSVLATLSLILFQTRVCEWLKGWWPGWLVEEASATLAAQILVMPIIMVTFGSMSSVFLVSNLLILWSLPGVMLVGAIIMVAGQLWWTLGLVLSWLIYPVLWYIREVIMVSASLPVPGLEMKVEWWMVGAYYGGLGLVVMAIEKREALIGKD